MEKYNICFNILRHHFPVDTMWVDGQAEIIGYSPKENLHIVINDGNCYSEDGFWLVFKYRPKNPDEHLALWNSGVYPLKYLVDEEYADFISQERMNLTKRPESLEQMAEGVFKSLNELKELGIL